MAVTMERNSEKLGSSLNAPFPIVSFRDSQITFKITRTALSLLLQNQTQIHTKQLTSSTISIALNLNTKAFI